MVKYKGRILITAALPYVNNVPHLGNIIVTLSADIYARYLRLAGYETIFICGTDEHGTTTEVAALKEGTTPKKICDKYYKIHKKCYEWLNFSFDNFGRTSNIENHKTTQEFFLKLKKNGYISEKITEQAYCPKCKRFLADRFIEGTCPNCGYNDARGDQCDECGKLLNPKELKNPRCKVCDGSPIFKKSKHLFLRTSKLSDKLKKWILKQKHWPQNARNFALSWIKEGLKDRSITRDLRWGVKIPLKGWENKKIYCWFDAPIGYLSITKEYTKNWKKWWCDKKAKIIHFIGKDNIPFHTITWPGTLVGVGGYNLPWQIASNEFLNYEGGQFSKSRNRGVFCTDAMETGIDHDIWRYYLTANRPEKADTEFTWEDFNKRINNELVSDFSNFVYRTISFTARYYDKTVPGFWDKEIEQKVNDYSQKIGDFIYKTEYKKALELIFELIHLGNKYFQDKKPWETIKTDPPTAEKCINTCLNLIKSLSVFLFPIIPNTCKKIWEQLNIKEIKKWQEYKFSIKKGHKINDPKMLFKRIDEKKLKEFKQKFSGKGGIKMASINDFEKLELRIGKILKAEKVKGTDNLLKLEVDTGEKRILVAGIAKQYKPEETIGKEIVVLTNLKPAVIKGIKSEGMLLAAVEKGKTILIVPDKKINKGSKVC